jgi:hypothetical protein
MHPCPYTHDPNIQQSKSIQDGEAVVEAWEVREAREGQGVREAREGHGAREVQEARRQLGQEAEVAQEVVVQAAEAERRQKKVRTR